MNNARILTEKITSVFNDALMHIEHILGNTNEVKKKPVLFGNVVIDEFSNSLTGIEWKYNHYYVVISEQNESYPLNECDVYSLLAILEMLENGKYYSVGIETESKTF